LVHNDAETAHPLHLVVPPGMDHGRDGALKPTGFRIGSDAKKSNPVPVVVRPDW
jgi:hypothetical protein